MTYEDKQKLAEQIAEKAMSAKNVTYAVVMQAVYEAINSRDKEIEQLRNPWISVKDRLPEDGDVVITRIVHVVKGGGEHSESVQHLEQIYRGRWWTDSMEQHRRNGILYDCISEVTHWMPIPKLDKDGDYVIIAG